MSAARRTMSGCRQTSRGRGVMREYCGVFISCLAFIVVPISRQMDVEKYILTPKYEKWARRLTSLKD